MKKEFIPYEQALALKELGFDETCFGHYQQEWDDDEINELEPSLHMIFSKQHQHAFQSCTAPTFSQAFRWFREKYDYSANIRRVGVFSFVYEIFTNDLGVINSDLFGGYEKAELECLKKLIQIVKQKLAQVKN